MKFLSILLSVLCLGFTYKTPLGITIYATPATVIQYEEYWELKWDDIEWGRIDEFFLRLQEAYGSNANPKRLRIRIMPWHPNCVDAESPEYEKEFLFWGMCIDGAYPGQVLIHLGDDSGQGKNYGQSKKSWCLTALDYEMGHFFLRAKRDPCWYYEFFGDCPTHYIFGSQVGLCN